MMPLYIIVYYVMLFDIILHRIIMVCVLVATVY